MKYGIFYVLGIVMVNIGFSIVPPIDLGFGKFAPMALLVGLIFVLRDYAQRELGHWVLVPMIFGTLISFLLADPFVALASAAAFAVSEIVDWLVYTVTKRPFHQRILVSSIFSTPVDTIVFLTGIGFFTLGTFAIMFASKMFAAILVWYLSDPDLGTEIDYSKAV